MGIYLGIDLGSSTVKAAGIDEGGSFLPLTALFTAAPLTSPESFVRHGLEESGVPLSSVEGIAVTGTGAGRLPPVLCGKPIVPIEEFPSTAAGALLLSGAEEGLVVSMGTGTAFIHARGDLFRSLPGSGIGGGTLRGLCARLAGVDTFSEICALCAEGNATKVDLTLRDLGAALPPGLHPDMTLSNFGREGLPVSSADLIAGAANLVLQAIGTMAVLACQGCSCSSALLTGSLTVLPQTRQTFSLFERLYGVRFLLPPHADRATAAGAALLGRKRQKAAG